MPRSQSYNIGVFLFTPSIETYVNEYAARSHDKIYTSGAGFEKAVAVAKDWEAAGVEVFISRRGTGQILRNAVSTPVLSLPLSEIELISNLRGRGKKGERVLLTVFKEESPHIPILGEVLGITIVQGIYSTQRELDTVVKNAVYQDISLIAGGGTTMRAARKYGLPYVEVPPTRDHFMNTLENARNVARSNREKDAHTHEMRCMMDAISDGLVSMNCQGLVLSMNQAAQMILAENSEDPAPVKDMLSYVSHGILQDIVRGKKDNVECIREINGAPVVINVHPVRSKSGVERLIATMRTSQDSIRQSGKIRSFYSRGFVAGHTFSDIIHKDAKMRRIIDLCKAYAKPDSSVLITGETGTGKEMLAQGIHNHGQRKAKPFVSVNCAELPEQLLESELFGYDDGAFTGSRKGGKAGFFEMAHTGTILLDEIDSAAPSVQGKLLRVLQEKEIMRIGGTRKIPIDVKVITASGHDLWQKVLAGTFRKDLFFRLNVMAVNIPPLRERKDDIDALLPYFVEVFARQEKLEAPYVGSFHLSRLKEYSWPGNVRQLRHFAERYVLHAGSIPTSFDDLYTELLRVTASARPQYSGSYPVMPYHQDPAVMEYSSPHQYDAPAPYCVLEQPLDSPAALKRLLEQVRYSKKEAARALGISRSTLWRKMKSMNIG